MLQQIIDRIMAELDRTEEAVTQENRAKVLYIRGRALDAKEGFDQHAEAYLSRAVKLDPANVDAWNALGHCYWKKGDLQEASSCFRESLSQARNVKALQQLSMLLRVIKTSAGASNIEASLDLAKQAVVLNVQDPVSWYVLGNAHLTRFFAISLEIEDLHKALKAYNIARQEQKGGGANPDLHFNKANVQRYLQDYTSATVSYRRAHAIDPSLPAEAHVQDLTEWLHRLSALVSKKGRVKPKRVEQLVASLQESATQSPVPTTAVAMLTPGLHAGVRVYGKALLSCTKGTVPPECFLFLDSDGNVCVLAVYNLSSESCSAIVEKDMISLDDPIVHDVVVTNVDEVTTLRFVQVQHLEKLLLEGQSIPRAAVASARLRVDTFDA